MPVRLLKPYNGQNANTTYWGTDERQLIASGLADDQVELASDYQQGGRIVTSATANTGRNATTYVMNSGSAQTLTLQPSAYWPVGTTLTVMQLGSAKTTVAPATGVTINQGNGVATLLTGGQNYLGQLVKVGLPDTWVAFGGFGG